MHHDVIFFDIGNTLFFYDYEFLRGFLVECFEIDRSPQELERAHGAMHRQLIDEQVIAREHEAVWNEAYRRWFGLLEIDEKRVGAITTAIRVHPFGHLFWGRMQEGTRELLDWFAGRGYRLGIISNAEGQIQRLVEHAGIADRFEAVIDSGELAFEKPDVRIFRHAAEAMRTTPERCIHIGDLVEVDVAGARGAGFTPILVDREGGAQIDCPTVRTILDLPALELFRSGA